MSCDRCEDAPQRLRPHDDNREINALSPHNHYHHNGGADTQIQVQRQKYKYTKTHNITIISITVEALFATKNQDIVNKFIKFCAVLRGF